MRFGSCFAGIGGFDLGLEAAGMTPVWQIELNEYSRSILARHWPDVARFADITHVPLNVLTGVDLVCGGFPCQDISVAGQQVGLNGERSKLWFNMRDVIERARPRWVVIENSPALRTRGADTVLGQLEALDYACWPVVVGAWAVGAGHRRDRAWIIGRLDNAMLERSNDTQSPVPTRGHVVVSPSELAYAGIPGREGVGEQRVQHTQWPPYGRYLDERDYKVEYASRERLERRGQRLPRRWPASPVEPQFSWEPSRTVKRTLGRGPNGFPARLAERRRKRELEALGAAVVPQIAEAIGRAIMTVELQEHVETLEIASDLQALFT